MSIVLDQPVRRDRWGRYLVLPPEGGKPVGYTRATTVAKALDDQSSLINWRSRMTAVGLAQRPDLLAMVAGAGDDKRRLDELCEKAAEHGGATVRRDLGTAIHGFLEQAIADPTITIPQPHRGDVDAILATLAAHGLTIVPGMCERMIVLDEARIAGTVDLVVEDRNGARYIADLKTGASVQFGASSWALQLAIYAHADALYAQGPAKDGSQDRRDHMPKVDGGIAYIVHCQPGSGTADLHQLQIGKAWDMVQVALQVRAWRNRKDLLHHVELPTLDVMLDAFPGAVLVEDDTVRHPIVRPNSERAVELRARARAALDAWGAEGARELRDCWPDHVPGLSNPDHVWKRRELDDIEEVVRGLERRYMPLPAVYPDGPIVDQDDATQAMSWWQAISNEARAELGRIERRTVEHTLWPIFDGDQDSREPLRARQWHLCRLLHTVCETFEPSDIEPVLNACAAHAGFIDSVPFGTVATRLTLNDLDELHTALLKNGVTFDATVDGTVVATLNNNPNK